MRAVCATNYDGPTGLRVLEIDAPTREDDEVLVEVKAVAPAFPDLLMSRGEYQVKPAPPFSPGSDFTGVVLESPVGSEFSPGTRVAGCLSFGAAAEQVSVGEDRLYPLPDELDFVQGAAIPMNYLTAHFALVTRGGLAKGDWVMVLGASGGVGLAAIQVAAGLGARVIAVVSSDERAKVALEAGAHHAVLRGDVPIKVRELTGDRGVDIVVDVVGGDMRNALRTLAPLGRVLAVGFASGEIPTVKVNRLLLTNTDIRGVESDYLWTAGISRVAWDELMALYREGFIKPVVQQTGPFEEYGTALAKLDERQVVGRVVLTV
ncbi:MULTISPECIES: NADPH:quinone oxidoreductase family protein [unclassified Mycolicibacterium]|uniref:NADPH:quinone oxidoreductase family protein n=1 Tax=unclassified Mycolicibacterium TaxID=2636767 RepID=UPI002ED7A4A3